MAPSARLVAASLWVVSLQLLGLSASAVELTIDPAESTVIVEMRLDPGCPGCAVDSLAFSGTVDASVVLSEDPTEGTVVGSLQIGSGNMALTDGSWLVPQGFAIFDVDTVGVGGTMARPPSIGTPVAPHTSEFELQGAVLTLNQGVLTIILVPLVDITEQLDVDPMTFSFDQSSVATATLTETLPDLYDVEVAIPIAVVTTYASLEVSMDGTIVMTGVVSGAAPVPSWSRGGFLAAAALLCAIAFTVLGRSRRIPAAGSVPGDLP